MAETTSSGDTAVRAGDTKDRLGRPPFYLESRPGGGYFANFQVGTCPVSGPVVLVAVEGKSIEGLDRAAINALLTGPLASPVKLTVLTVNAHFKDITVQRDTPADGLALERPTINFEQVDLRNLQPANDAKADDGLDIEARAAINLALRGVSEWPVENEKATLSGCLKRAAVNYEVGDLSSGDIAFNEAMGRFKMPVEAAVFSGADSPDLLETLCAVGREADAARLIGARPASGTWSFGAVDHFYRDLIWSTLRHGQKEKGEKYLRDYLWLSSMSGSPGYSRWLYLYYKQIGRYKDALALYPGRLEIAEHGVLGWLSEQEICAVLNERAFLEYRLGEKGKAQDTLKQAISRFSASLDAEQIACIEKTPGVYPKLADLKDAVTSLQNGKGFPCDPLSAEKFLTKNRPEVRAAVEAVAAGKKAQAVELVNDLLNCHPWRSNEPTDERGQVSLYCAVLNLARRMSDRGWNIESANVLDSLTAKMPGVNANVAAKIYLAAEQVYNDRGKSEKQLDTQWARLAALNPGPVNSPGWGGTSSVGSFSNLLRGLALNYYYADEMDRAEFFVARALDAYEKESAFATDLNSNAGAAANMKALYLLSAAIVAEGKKKTAQSIKLVNEAIALSNTPSSYCNFAMIELAYEFWRHGKRRSAIDFLELMRKEDRTLDTSPEAASQMERNTALVRLLYLDGKIARASSLANDLVQGVDPYRCPPLLTWLRASCAERQGNFALAAKLYIRVDCVPGWYYLRGVDAGILRRKAIALAEQASDFDKSELAKMYIDESVEVGVKNPKLMSELRIKAIPMLEDSSQAKFSTKLNVFYIKTSGSSFGIASSVPADKPEWSKRKWPGLSRSQKWEVNSLIDLAQEADANGFSEGRELWEQVMAFELNHGLIDVGMDQARKNLNRYTKKEALQYKRPIGFLFVAEHLLAAGRESEAEKFLDDVVARVKSVAGEHSVQAQAQLVNSFEFFLIRKEYEKAESVLKEILSFDLTTGATPKQYDSVSHCGPGYEQPADDVEITAELIKLVPAADKDFAYRVHFLEMILAAHEKALNPDDERLVVILKTIAETYFARKNYQTAQQYYDRAFAINKNNYKGVHSVWRTGNHFCDNLRALGRKQEAVELEELP